MPTQHCNNDSLSLYALYLLYDSQAEYSICQLNLLVLLRKEESQKKRDILAMLVNERGSAVLKVLQLNVRLNAELQVP